MGVVQYLTLAFKRAKNELSKSEPTCLELEASIWGAPHVQ